MHPLLYAARPLVLDFLGTIVFLVLVALKVDPTIAAASGIVIGVGQVLVQLVLRKPIAPLQWMGLGLVLVFGTASLLTHDLRFLMVKPTIIYALIGAVMLKKGWMLRYMPPQAQGHGTDVMIAFGYVWSGLMFLTGALNIVFALAFTDQWVKFMAVFPMASKLVMFAIQYAVTRAVVRRRILAERALQEPVAAAA